MTRLESWIRPEGIAAALFAIATTLMLQSSRAFVSYLVFVVDQSQRATIAAIALVVFAFPALTWLLVRRAGLRGLFTAAVALLIVTRLSLQIVEQPVTRLVSSGAAMIAWGVLTVLMVAGRRRSVAAGLALSFGLDLALRTARNSLDLLWMPGPVQTAQIVVLAALLACCWWYLRDEPGAAGSSWRSAGALIVIGPAVALFHLVSGNIAFVSTHTGLSASGSSALLAAGIALGVLIAVLRLLAISLGAGGGALVSRFILFDAIIGAVALGFAWSGDGMALLGALFVTVATTELVLFALAASDVDAAGRLVPASLLTTAGLLVQFVVLFIYYTSTGSGAMLAVAWLGLVVGTLIASLSLTGSLQSGPLNTRAYAAPVAVVAALLIGSIAWSYSNRVTPAARPGHGESLAVITYNIQSGFSRDNYWDLEATARVIEESGAELVFLQEVSRGWLVTSGNDQLAWLSRRLDMPYAWGPASSDDLWGNAILSRYPIESERIVKFNSTQNLRRSALLVELDVGDDRTLVAISTHLDNPDGASLARSEQVEQLIALLALDRPTVLAGDFNMTPEDPLMAEIGGVGLIDAGAAAGALDGTSEDGRRIDYVFVRPDLAILDAVVIDTDASDHRPVAVTVALP